MDFKDFSKTVQIRIVLKFFTVVTNTAVLPFIVLFFANEIGAVKVTFLTLLIGAVTFVGSAIGGRLADLKGRKFTILLGEMGATIGFILLCFGQVYSEYMILLSIVAFFITNFFTAIVLPGYSAIILDETTVENRKFVYIYSMWTSYLGFAIGSTIGGLLFASHKLLLFNFIVLTSVVTIIVIFFFIPETIQKMQIIKEPQTVQTQPGESLFKIIWKEKILCSLLLLGFIFQLMDNQIGYYLALRFYDLFGEASYSLLGFLRTENTIIAVIFLLFVKKLLKHLNEMTIAFYGLIILFGGYICLSMFEQMSLLYVAMFIASVGEITLFPALQGLSANYIPVMYRGRYSSLANNLGMLGGLLAVTFMLLQPIVSPIVITGIYGVTGLIAFFAIVHIKREVSVKKQKMIIDV